MFLADPVDSDDPTEVARSAGFHARERVLEDRATRWLHAESPRRRQERVRLRLAA